MAKSLSTLTPIARACRFARSTCPDALLKTENWPTVDEEQLAKHSLAKRARFKRLSKAIELYMNEGALKDVLKIATLKKARFYEVVKRCLNVNPIDGRINGFRALIKDARLKKGERRSVFKLQSKPNTGYAYVFIDFMRTQTEIREEVVAYLRGVGAAVLRMNDLQFRQAHRFFKKACEKDGRIAADEYPLRIRDEGARSFREWIKNEFLPLYGKDWMAREYGPSAETAWGYQDGDGKAVAPIMPGEAWQIDEYKVDCEAGYEYPNAFGDYEVFELPFTLAIRAIDVATGARIATRLVLSVQTSVDDLVRLLWDAINGMTTPVEVLPDLKPKPGAGYVASVIDELRFHVPRIIYLDNALAHLANHLRHTVEHLWGCEVKDGTAGTPEERGAIEASFSKMARGLVRHVPYATGSGPRDPLRRAAAAAGHPRLSADALEQSIHVYSQNENVLPAAASMNIAPLERLRRQLETKALVPNYLPPGKRHPHFFCKAKSVTVKADLEGQNPRRPYVNFMYGRYSSPLLQRSIGLVGKKLIARADLDNFQTIWLFHESGAELGPVHVLGKWGSFPHDIRIRKMFGKLKAEGALGEHAEDDPLDAIYKALRPKASTDRHAAQKLAYLFTYLTRHGFPPSAVIINEILHWQATVLAAEGIMLVPIIKDPTPAAAPVQTAVDPNVIDMEPVAEVASSKGAEASPRPMLPAPPTTTATPVVVPPPAIVEIVNRAASAARAAAPAVPPVPAARTQPSYLNLPRRIVR